MTISLIRRSKTLVKTKPNKCMSNFKETYSLLSAKSQMIGKLESVLGKVLDSSSIIKFTTFVGVASGANAVGKNGKVPLFKKYMP